MHSRISRLSAVVIFIVAAVMPAIGTADIHPALRMEFSVKESDLSDLIMVLTRYAEKADFTVENVGPHMPPKNNRPKRGIRVVWHMHRDRNSALVSSISI